MPLRVVRPPLLVLLILCVLAFRSTTERGPATRAWQGHEKSIFVTALNRSNTPLTDLSSDDVVVLEDNVKRAVATVSLAKEPLYVVLVIDTAKPMAGVPAPTRELRAALASFVNTVHAASPDAQFSIVDCAGASVRTVDFTASTAVLNQHIQRIASSQRASVVMLEALVDAARSLSETPSPRRVIVSINFDTPEASTIMPGAVVGELQKSGATLWSVSIQSAPRLSAYQAGTQGMDNESTPTREVVLEAATKASGGMHLTAVSASVVESLTRRVAEALTSQYLVTYMRPDGPPKSIKPEVARAAKVLMPPWVR